MQEIVNKLMEILGSFLPEIDVSIKLGVIGAVLVLIVFFIALAIATGSKIDAYRKVLIGSTKWLGGIDRIDEENVEELYRELGKHPEEASKGWSRFMDQRIGYPSDYMPAKDVLGKREFSGKGTAGKVFMIIFGIIVCAVVALVGFMSDVEATDIMSAILAIEFVVIPVAAYIICILLIDIDYNRKIRRLEMAYMSFCEILDEKVMVEDKEEREFVSENLDEINKRVEELIAGRMDDDEVVEVVTAPKVEEVEEVEEVAEEPVEEVVAAEEEIVVTPTLGIEDMTEEEKEELLSVLLDIVDRAIEDEECTDDDLCEIAAILYEARISNAYEAKEEEIMDECLTRIANKVQL